VAIREVAAHLCLTLIIKELKIGVEEDTRVVTTLNIIFSVVAWELKLSLRVNLGYLIYVRDK
jgi:hypothetical protein